MSWLDADDDDDYDYDFDFLDVVSEYRPRGPTALPRRVFKVGGLAPSLSPLQPGPGSDLSPEAGLRPPTRHKARPLRDCEKRTHKGEEMYEVEQLRKERKQVTFQSNVAKPIKAPPDGMMRNSVCLQSLVALFPSTLRIVASHLKEKKKPKREEKQRDEMEAEEKEKERHKQKRNDREKKQHHKDRGCEDSLLNDAREKMSHQDSRSFATTHTRSKEKQECTRRSLKHRSLNSKLFEELPKDQFPFDWSKKNGVGLGGNKVLSSELKRNDKHFRVPTVAQAHGIEGCKAKNVQQLHKEFTYGAPETHTFSSKTHNGLCCSLSFPSSQKLQSYHNPLHGASATFIHRLTEIAGLECDTIRHEKIRKLKKRSDC
ncbi:uncharacterized protein si:ch211-171b20.3 isoform X2 [Heptranchias perlo]|uniref:uncharacterized protein si:ch211-171b20.3 isoform X2 n=1 Tax=Heptranchias perlo TaxID=212740 RepID=UPI003559BB94